MGACPIKREVNGVWDEEQQENPTKIMILLRTLFLMKD